MINKYKQWHASHTPKVKALIDVSLVFIIATMICTGAFLYPNNAMICAGICFVALIFYMSYCDFLKVYEREQKDDKEPIP